jgi:Ser/Thr protein kinase RdoA (MazF antagonist)
LDYALRYQKLAADKAALAPVLIPTTDGLMSVHRGGNDFVLEACLPGIPRSLTRADAAQCGATLGRLHLATCELSYNLPISGAWEFLAGMAYAHIRAIVKTCPDWEQQAPGFLQHWTTSIELMSAFLADVSLPRGVHGDVNPTNLLWDGKGLRFCDFTNASPLPQFVDVAMGVIGLGILKWDFRTHAEVLPESVSASLPFVEEYLASYNNVRRLLPQEKAMLPDALRVLWGFWSYWFPVTKSNGTREVQRLSVELDTFAGTSFRRIIDQL